VLQALAQDGILPRWLSFLGTGSGHDNTPRYGTVLTLVIVLATVWVGDLNLIAPVLTMFFLTTYGVLNFAAGIERFLGSPSFRPSFKVHWIWSLLGGLGCIAAMILVNWQATIVAVLIVGGIFLYLERRELESVWGDLRRGVWMSMTRAGLMRLEREVDPKSWRPNPLVFSGAPRKRWYLIHFANNITHDRGILSVGTILTGDNLPAQDQNLMEENIESYMRERSVQGFSKVLTAPDLYEGASRLVESYGIGPLVPNTIILGSPTDPELREEYFHFIKEAHARDRNIAVISKGNDGEEVYGNQKEIHVWWGGLKGNGGLMLILAYLLQSGVEWHDAEVHVKMIVNDESGVEDARANLERITDEIRIGAEVDVYTREKAGFQAQLREHSANADLIFLGMAEPDDEFDSYFQSQLDRVEDLPTTVFVLAGEEISFGEVLIQKDRME
jgi:hypothetical protein